MIGAPGEPGADGLRALLEGAPQVVAPALLGMLLVVGERVGAIVEVEAYGGGSDPASHAHPGERVRNRSLFAEPGTLYAYRSYGIHTCANVVTSPPGVGAGVLIRAVRPVAGVEAMRAARPTARREVELTNGPGRLAQALGVELRDDGIDLLDPRSRVRLLPGSSDDLTIATSTRVGISRATEKLWRFYVADDPYVSRWRPAARRTGRG